VLESLHDDKYEVLHEIGQGGMAVVFKGRDKKLNREVAIKILHPHLAGRADSRMRLQREARAVASLKHPNILEIYDYSGLESPESYIVTEYIRGETLKDFADRHTPSLPEVGAMIVHEIADALAHAHGKGIIHRDIKPENIMIRDDGALKLMDFGIAQIVDMQAMTVTGALVGSPAHMSPEHVEGKPLDFRADVFSLGTLLYFMCAGRLPFDSASPHALLRQILEADYEDPRMHNPAIGRRLYGIIARCLEREPDDRYDGVERLRDDLANYLTALTLDEPAEELAIYFDDPATAEAALTQRVGDRLMELAQEDAGDGRVASALEHYNQVLALHGDREDALTQVQRLTHARSRNTTLRRVGIAVAALLVIGLIVWGALPSDKAASEPEKEAVAQPVAVEPAELRPTPAPAPSKAEEPAPQPVQRVVRGAEEGMTRRLADRRPVDLSYVPQPVVKAPVAVIASVQPRRPRVRPRKPAVKPAAPQPAAPAKGHQFKISARYGGYVVFEGKKYASGITGTLVRQPGTYRVTIGHDDPSAIEKVWSFKVPGKASIKFSPGFKKSTLRVTGAPAGARVDVAGRQGRPGSPITFSMSTPTKRVYVTVTMTGYETVRRSVTLRAGGEQSVRMALKPAAP